MCHNCSLVSADFKTFLNIYKKIVVYNIINYIIQQFSNQVSF